MGLKEKKSQKEVERISKQVKDIEEQLSSGMITGNQAREALGLPKCADEVADMILKSEKSCNSRILYKCNGQKEDCRKTNCFKHGGSCRHTQDIKYAENFHKTKCGNWMEGKEAAVSTTDTTAYSINELP